jgi:hypothetical protein
MHARENPFFPSIGEKDIPLTTNKQMTFEPLKRATITLPSNARVIKKVIVSYENLDGSIEQTSIELANSIDWHLPLFVSQSYVQNEAPAEQNLQQQNSLFKEIASIESAKFFINEKRFKIQTQDKMIRNFMLVTPHRIVIDFDRESNLKSFISPIQNSVFTKVRIGNHDKFYRVVVELDGYYTYKMSKSDNGYIFKLQ